MEHLYVIYREQRLILYSLYGWLICFKFRVTSREDEKRHFPKRRVVLAIVSNEHINNFKMAVPCVVTMEEVQ